MLYNIVLVSAIHQQESAMVYICPFPLEPPSHLLSHPIPPLWIVTEHWVELPVSYSKFPLAIYFTYANVYVSMLYSQFVPPSPFSAVSTSLFSMAVSPLLPCK